MPSIITHAVVGVAAGNVIVRQTARFRFWFFSILCPLIPDADTLAFSFGIPYAHLFGHRGFFHSLAFALILSFVITFLFFGKEHRFSRNWFFLLIYFFILTASHGILDAFTSGGLGIALLAPFDNTRYFFPVTPIAVSPLSIRAFFGSWGLRVLMSEMLWVWFPAAVVVVLVRLFRRLQVVR